MESDGYYFDIEHGEQISQSNQKIFFNIPIQVSKGSYTICVKYRSGDLSTISVTSLSHPEYVKCDNIALSHLPMELPGSFNIDYGLDYLPGYQSSNMYITHDVKDLDVYVIYSGYKHFYIESIELIGNRNYIKTILPVFAFILVILDLLLIAITNNITPINNKTFQLLIILLLMIIISSIPIFFRYGINYDDLGFLYNRIEGLKNGLLDGQFPVRIHPSSLYRYGYALSYFYPDFFIYPFALLRIWGYSLNFSLILLYLSINTATVCITYYSTKKMLKADIPAIIGTFLYTFSLYRLVDMFSRGAVAEAIAMVFFPLFIAGLYSIILDEKSYVPLSVSIFGLINSHILSCEMILIFSFFLLVLCPKKIFKKNVILSISKAVSLSLLLSSYFIIPFLHMSTTDIFKVYADNAYLTSDNMLTFANIIAISCSTFATPDNNAFICSRYCLGIFFIIILVLSTIYLFVQYKEERTALYSSNDIPKINDYKLSLLFLILGIIALIMTSSIFPWKSIESTGGIIRTFLCMIQFPWRYLSIAYILLTYIVCIAVKKVLNNRKELSKPLKTILIIAVVAIIVPVGIYFVSVHNNTSDLYTLFDKGGIAKSSGVGMGEYEPAVFPDNIEFLDKSIEELQTIFNTEYFSEKENGSLLIIESFEKIGTKATAVILNPTNIEKTLYMPYTYYYGYNVTNSFDNGDIPKLFETNTGTIGITIPANYYNGVHIEYKVPLLYRFAEFLSLITLISFIALKISVNHRLRNSN